MVFGAVPAFELGHDRLVTGVAHRGEQSVRTDDAGVEHDGGLLGGEVDVRRGDTIDLAKAALDARRATGARHALHAHA